MVMSFVVTNTVCRLLNQQRQHNFTDQVVRQSDSLRSTQPRCTLVLVFLVIIRSAKESEIFCFTSCFARYQQYTRSSAHIMWFRLITVEMTSLSDAIHDLFNYSIHKVQISLSQTYVLFQKLTIIRSLAALNILKMNALIKRLKQQVLIPLPLWIS